MENKSILITGASGSIGSELYRQLAQKNRILAVDQNESALFDLHEEYAQKGCDVLFRIGDIRDERVVKEIFQFMPEVVFHCAALKHVYPTELLPREAVQTNVLGTLNIVEEAKRTKVPTLIYISTDKVINGNSVMGVTKKLGELITRNAGYVAVRFGNVLGSRGSLLPIWERQLAKGEPLTVTDERAERFFMTIEEAVALVIKAGTLDVSGTLVMEMGERKNILALAKEILGKVGKPDYPIKMIGLRKGETLSEEIMTPTERETATKIDEFYLLK